MISASFQSRQSVSAVSQGTGVKIFLLASAAIFILFGAMYLWSPENLAGVAGLSYNASGLTDIRATYGGFQIGFGLFMLWSAQSAERYGAALVAVAVIFASVGLGRFYGLMVDGQMSVFHNIGLAFEAGITLIALWFRRSLTAQEHE